MDYHNVEDDVTVTPNLYFKKFQYMIRYSFKLDSIFNHSLSMARTSKRWESVPSAGLKVN